MNRLTKSVLAFVLAFGLTVSIAQRCCEVALEGDDCADCELKGMPHE